MSETTPALPSRPVNRKINPIWVFLGIVAFSSLVSIWIPYGLSHVSMGSRPNSLHGKKILAEIDSFRMDDSTKAAMVKHRDRMKLCEDALTHLDTCQLQITMGTAPEACRALNEKGANLKENRENIKAICEKEKPKVTVSGFTDQTLVYKSMVYWICLLTLLFIFRPVDRTNGKAEMIIPKLFPRNILAGFIAAALLSAFPLVMRYFTTETVDLGRRLFSMKSWEINKFLFFYDLLEDFVTSCLLGSIWFSWWEATIRWKDTESEVGTSPILVRSAQSVSELFTEWQRNSVVLACAFLPWAIFEWTTPREIDGEKGRYIYMAIIDHLFWIGTWALLSAPLVLAIARWRRAKFHLLRKCGQPGEMSVEAIQACEPISNFQLIGATLAGMASVIFPIIGLFKDA